MTVQLPILLRFLFPTLVVLVLSSCVVQGPSDADRMPKYFSYTVSNNVFSLSDIAVRDFGYVGSGQSEFINDVMWFNNLQTTSVYIGQTLKIPKKYYTDYFKRKSPLSTSPPILIPDNPNSGYTTYTVRKGDNLYRIGLKFGISATSIMNLNGLPNTTIHVGQTLRIPSH